MNKNSILAVLLSGLVLFAYIFVQTKFFTPAPAEANNTEQLAEENPAEAETAAFDDTAQFSVPEEDGENEIIEEKTFTIETNKVKVSFTNRGGDVIGIELVDHKDTKTQKPVQMAENISEKNRAFALNMGPAGKPLINDFFIEKEFPVDSKGNKKIAFAKKYKDYTLIKQYTFTPDDYMFKLDIIIDGNENFNGLSFDGKEGEKVSYTIRTSPQIGPFYNPKVDRYESRSFIGHNGSKIKRIQLTENQTKKYGKDFIWAGIGGKYFCELLIPENPMILEDVYYSTPRSTFAMSDAQDFFERKEISEKRVDDSYYIYVGPRSEKDLKKYSSADSNGWGFEGKRISDALVTSTFLGWLETIFKWMMEVIYKIVPNWGISIIIMTIILKLVLFPLTLKSSLGTLKMQEMQPRMVAIQNKYKDNPQKLQMETAKLYQETGYNPMSGCLPMIFQMMALFAMYNLFNNYFEFRGASFVKGWIDDLSVGDSIWSWEKHIFIISGITGNHIRILPIVYLFSQLFYGKITRMGGAAAAAGQNAGMMKFMTYGLPILFSFMFYNAPAGLLLFWTVSNIIQMAQQLIINKVMEKKKGESKNSKVIKFSNKKGKK